MSRRRNLLILVGILAILTAFLMAAYWPSTLPQVLGKDFAQLKEVQIHLSHVRNNSPSRDLTLSPDDPATGDLLALLEGQRYRPVYHNPWGAISGHPTALDYAIYGVFVFQGEDGGVSVPFYFDGYREVSIGSGGPSPPGFPEEEDTMTKKQKRWLALGGVALAVGLLAWAFWPRTFAQTVGEGYDPSQIWEMQVTLNDVADPDRSRAVVLSAGDPALEEALSILNGQRYRPIYHWGAITGKSVPLDYYIAGFLVFEKEGDGYPASFFYFSGNREAVLSRLDGEGRSYRVEQAFQQELLDLLLAQPYTQKNPVEQEEPMTVS